MLLHSYHKIKKRRQRIFYRIIKHNIQFSTLTFRKHSKAFSGRTHHKIILIIIFSPLYFIVAFRKWTPFNYFNKFVQLVQEQTKITHKPTYIQQRFLLNGTVKKKTNLVSPNFLKWST